MNRKNSSLRSGNTVHTEVSNDGSFVFNIPGEMQRQVNIDSEIQPFKSPQYKRYTKKDFTKKLTNSLNKLSDNSKAIKKDKTR